ncbi:MAG: hypothetical protein K8R59_04795 [Thermoanaerobaculales bacterium]|nr:hypothetical protein [Thermoanaerobaculales bacterium]
MNRQHGLVYLIGLFAAFGLCLVSGMAGADDIAWDMMDSTSRNVVSYMNDAPAFSSSGDGFQKYTVVQQVCPPIPVPNLNDIPYAVVDDSACIYPTDGGGIIDTMTDFDEFFGVCDTENSQNSGPVTATWVFDISSAGDHVRLSVDLAAMGDFEAADSFVWTYQIDAGAVTPWLTAVADEAGAMTYTLANGTAVDLNDPLVVDGITLLNRFQTFMTPIDRGSQLTVVFTVTTDGGSEGFAARNLLVRDFAPGQEGGQPIPTLSTVGIAAMILMLMVVGVFLFRRLR